MIFQIVVKNVPDIGTVDFLADLPTGFLGPGLGRGLNDAFEYNLLGVQNFVKIRKVQLNETSSLTKKHIPLVETDIVPRGSHITIPILEVWCDWDENLFSEEVSDASSSGQLEFSSASVKPIVTCPFAKNSIKPVEQSLTNAPESHASEQTTLEPRTRTKRLKIFFTSALAEEYRGGDADYMKAIVLGLQKIGIDAARIANSSINRGQAQVRQLQQGQLVTLDYYGSLEPAQRQIEDDNLPAQTEATIQSMIEYFSATKEPDVIQVLNIQSRLPGSGSAFQTAETIKRFQDINVKVFVTVHEWKYNKKHLEQRWLNIESPTRDICEQAEGTIFVNDADYRDAKIDKSTFIPIPITVAFGDFNVEAVLQRPIRILMFGLLRPSKGFNKAVELGKLLRNKYIDNFDSRKECNDQSWSVQMVGKLIASFRGFLPIVKEVYGAEIFDDVFAANTLANINAEAGDNDDEFNRLVSQRLTACDVKRSIIFKRVKLLLAEKSLSLEALQEQYREKENELKAKLKTTLTETTKRLIRENEKSALAARVTEAIKINVWDKPSFTDDQLENFNVLNHLDSIAPITIDENLKDFVQNKLQFEAIKFLKNKITHQIKNLDIPLPVFFKLNLPENELINAFRECKYVYKPDDKGMADNASAMISPMANGCILFTNSGVVTPDEFLKDNYLGAPTEAIPPQNFRLYFKGRYAKSIIMAEGEWKAPELIAEIEKREEPSSQENRETLENLKHLIEHRYLPKIIATRNVIYFREMLGLNDGKIIIPKTEY